jgi:hypothetical protein
MNINYKFIIALAMAVCLFSACFNSDGSKDNQKSVLLKGLYSFGPEVKSFIDCESGSEFWVADSAKTLELSYTKLGFEKPYTPVYVELECNLIKSDTTTINGGYDSTMVVTKLLKISKKIPDGPCMQ